jgi:anti-sigma B factor antagonist
VSLGVSNVIHGLFMSHVIHERERDGLVILDVKGQLALGPDDSAIRQHLQALLEAGKKNVVINLQQVSSIDPAAVGLLTGFAEQFQNAGGRLVLLNPARDHSAGEALELDTTFPTYTDEQDAVNSFFPDRKVPHYDVLQFVEEEAQHHPDPELQEKQE